MQDLLRILVLSLVVGTLGCEADAVTPLFDDTGLAGDGNLRSLLETVRADRGVPGLAAMTVRGDSIVEMAVTGVRAQGFSAGATIHDRWHIGSLTKSMTATLAGVLVEHGLISWETTILDVFPEFSGNILPQFESIRLWELLEHVGGVSDLVNETPSWEGLWDDESPLPEQRARWSQEILFLPAVSERGLYHYSNGGYVIAGAMLERVSGESWEDLMRTEIFGPLGMNDTGFGAPGAGEPPDQPWGHVDTGSGWNAVVPSLSADNPPAMAPAGGVHTTMEDYSKYLLAHLAGTRGEGGLVSVATFDRLHTSQSGVGYTLGWSLQFQDWASGFTLSHNGSNRLWWAMVWIAPAWDFATITMVNAAGDPGFQAADFATIVLITRIKALIDQGL